LALRTGEFHVPKIRLAGGINANPRKLDIPCLPQR
jgi:hypothetical protein